MVAGRTEFSRFVFVDECSTNTSLRPLYAWSRRGERALCSAPRNWGPNVTLLASITLSGMGPSLAVEGVGMTLPPASIDLPLNISFPLHHRPSLRVSARGRGLPTTSPDAWMLIEAINIGHAVVRIEGIRASFIYTSFPMEVIFGAMTMMFELRELDGAPQPPCELRPGEHFAWTVRLDQLREPMAREETSLGPHSRFFDLRTREDVERWIGRGRLSKGLGNTVARMSHRRLAVALRDDQDGLHKAKVRWEPPDDARPIYQSVVLR